MNKYLILLIIAALMACGEKAAKNETEDPKEETDTVQVAGNFGAELSNSDVQALTMLQTTLDSEEEFNGKIEVTIDDVCQMKGCWMTAKLPDGRSMRITFKDYGFFVPKNSTGYTAIIEGKAIKKMTDEATLKHYAEESGKSKSEIEAIDGPGEELSFIAEGVKIVEN